MFKHPFSRWWVGGSPTVHTPPNAYSHLNGDGTLSPSAPKDGPWVEGSDETHSNPWLGGADPRWDEQAKDPEKCSGWKSGSYYDYCPDVGGFHPDKQDGDFNHGKVWVGSSDDKPGSEKEAAAAWKGSATINPHSSRPPPVFGSAPAGFQPGTLGTDLEPLPPPFYPSSHSVPATFSDRPDPHDVVHVGNPIAEDGLVAPDPVDLEPIMGEVDFPMPWQPMTPATMPFDWDRPVPWRPMVPAAPSAQDIQWADLMLASVPDFGGPVTTATQSVNHPLTSSSFSTQNGMAKTGKSGRGKRPKSARKPRQKKVSQATTNRTRVRRTRAPRIIASTTGDGAVRIQHTEYLGDIANTTTTFESTSYALNPGLVKSFPWLASVARNFNEYEFVNLRFYYETEAATTIGGCLMMATNPDAVDSAPTTKQDMSNLVGYVRTAPWKEVGEVLQPPGVCGVRRFIRQGSVSNTDLKTYDAGNFIVATQGISSPTTIGELYVQYDVVFRAPIRVVGAPGAKIVNASATTASTFGTAPTTTGSLGSSVSAATKTITFSQTGTYLMSVTGVGTTLVNPTTSASTATISAGHVINSAATSILSVITVTVTAVGQTVVLDYSGSATFTSVIVYIATDEVSAI